MRIRVTMPVKDGKRLKEKLVEGAESLEEEEWGTEQWEAVRLIYFDFALVIQAA